MRILLINSSPVVGKLVTLSAQKTGDELEVVDSLDHLPEGNFDLLLIDSEFYSDESMQQIKDHLSFEKSVLISDRGQDKPDSFSLTLEKPFLPTDLVEILLSINNPDSSDLDSLEDDEMLHGDELEHLDDHDLESVDSLSLEGEHDLNFGDLDDATLALDEDLSLEDEEEASFDEDLDSTSLQSDNDLDLSDLDDSESAETSRTILDENDISEVKNLLEDEDLDHADTLDDELNEHFEEVTDTNESALEEKLDDGLSFDVFDSETKQEAEESTLDTTAFEEEPAKEESLEEDLDDGLSFDVFDSESESDTQTSLNNEDLLEDFDFDEAHEEEPSKENALEEVSDLDDAGEETLMNETSLEALESTEDLDFSLDDDLGEIENESSEVDDLDLSLDDDSAEIIETAAQTEETASHIEDDLGADDFDFSLDDDLTQEKEKEPETDELDDLLNEVNSLDESPEDELEHSETTEDMDFDDSFEEETPVADDETTDDEIEAFEDEVEPEDDEEELVVAGGEFASLTEEALSEALGEKEADNDDLLHVDFGSDELTEAEEFTPQEETTTPPQALPTELHGDAQTLQTLLSSLSSEQLRSALKGMKISINISFDE